MEKYSKTDNRTYPSIVEYELMAKKMLFSMFAGHKHARNPDVLDTIVSALIQADVLYDGSKKCKLTTYRYIVVKNAYFIRYHYMRTNKFKKFNHANSSLSMLSNTKDSMISKISVENSIFMKELVHWIESTDKLNSSQKEVIISHFLNNESTTEIGARLNLTRQRVSQIKIRALEIIKLAKSEYEDLTNKTQRNRVCLATNKI